MIAGLILSAGESRRMGRDKALLTYRGQSFLQTILYKLIEAGIEQVTVVLGHHAEIIQRELDLSCARVVVNREYVRGQTSSLQLGLAAAAADNPAAIILCLVDHPAISSAVIEKLKQEFEPARPPVLIPTCKGERGHPVVISRNLFPELLSLQAEEPANTVIRKFRAATRFVEVGDPGILLDVDDPETYRGLLKANRGC